MVHDLAIIVVGNLLFIGSYGINMDVIHLLVLFKHQYCVQFLDTNVIRLMYHLNMNVVCLFMLFTKKSYTTFVFK